MQCLQTAEPSKVLLSWEIIVLVKLLWIFLLNYLVLNLTVLVFTSLFFIFYINTNLMIKIKYYIIIYLYSDNLYKKGKFFNLSFK